MPTTRGVMNGVAVAATWIVVACGGSSAPQTQCGPGTVAEGNECVAIGSSGDDASCGPGTYLSGTACLPLEDSGARGGDDAGVGTPDASASDDGGGDASVDVQTACLVGDDIFVIAGDDYIHSGPPLVIEGGAGWRVDIQQQVNGLPSFLNIDIGINWTANFSTASLGVPLLPGTYTNIERAEFTDPNRAGLDVFGDGAGCDTDTGQFTVIDMEASSDDAGTVTLKSFTATFEQHCEGGPQYNVGCVHVSQ
jgi:hypothetical protein